MKSNTFSVIKIPDLPRHTQSVEGYIELVLKASFLVNGHASREGLIKKNSHQKLRCHALALSLSTQLKTLQ